MLTEKILNKIVNDFSMFFKKTFHLNNEEDIVVNIYSYHYFDPIQFEECVNKYGAEICRELRGATIVKNLKNGETKFFPSISKFFNLNENKFSKTYDEIPDKVDLYEKLDGSLISPLIIKNDIIFKSKNSINSEQAIAVNNLYKDNKEFKTKLLKLILEENIYPQFEYVAPDNLIVVYYNKPELRLIAARHYNPNTQTFEYIRGYNKLKQIANYLNVPIIEMEPNVSKKELLNRIETYQGIEGWCIYHEEEYPFIMSKIKTKWYLKLHKLSPQNLSSKYLLEKIINDEIDDIMSSLSDNPELKGIITKQVNKIYRKIEEDVEKIKQYKKEFEEIGIREFGKKYGKELKWMIGKLKSGATEWEIVKFKYTLMLKKAKEKDIKKYFGLN